MIKYNEEQITNLLDWEIKFVKKDGVAKQRLNFKCDLDSNLIDLIDIENNKFIFNIDCNTKVIKFVCNDLDYFGLKSESDGVCQQFSGYGKIIR